VQYSPPAELLAQPATEYVARFVGADRALKRLALIPIGTLDLAPLSGPAPVLRFSAETTARDALAQLLISPEQIAAVVDGDGQVLGVVGIETILAAARGAPLHPSVGTSVQEPG
jgi:osmoprotectant transport system ATP-binding protein